MSTFKRVAVAIALILLVCVLLYATNVALGMRAAPVNGTIAGLGVREPVTILRDGRDIPHIIARNEHDLFFAEGYVEASDRLFQMDLTKRFVEGRLAEVLGSAALPSDEYERTLPVERLAQKQWEHLSSHERYSLQAFSDGVNAAIRTQPLPVEFRILLYRPDRWKPQDSLVTSFGIVLDLADSWEDVADRAVVHGALYDRLHPLSDPCYDAPVTQGLAHITESPHCLPTIAELRDRSPVGSNEWATGAAHNLTGRALLANDPHLHLRMPGVWYLVDLRAPGYHVAGATFAGVPGVILGHDDWLAWGATDGTVTSLSVFYAPHKLNPSDWVTEGFHVRFGPTAYERYYRAPYEFGTELSNGAFVLVRWNAYSDPTSPLVAFDGLDHARSVEDGIRALRLFPGPTQNFVVADTTGRVAYQLAGGIPDDPAWGRYIHPSSDLTHHYVNVPFGRLPHLVASRETIAWTSNNKMYGPGYPYRLSPEFAPPYRAYRVAQLLKARSHYDVTYFTKMQMDTLSLPERDLARMMGIRSWSGRFDPSSRTATAIFTLRIALNSHVNQRMSATLIHLRTLPATKMRTFRRFIQRNDQPWGIAGAETPEHAFAALGVSFLNGTTFPGDGDAFSIHVQYANYSQSFRAVWDVGNWDAGGISLPQGESGEPGSGHYTDEANDWIAGRLLALPYSSRAVEKAAKARLTLLP